MGQCSALTGAANSGAELDNAAAAKTCCAVSVANPAGANAARWLVSSAMSGIEAEGIVAIQRASAPTVAV